MREILFRGKSLDIDEWVRVRLDILTRNDLEVIGNAYDNSELVGGDDHAAD